MFIGDVARVRYTEAALGLVNMLLEGSTDRQPPSEGPAMALGGQGLDAEVEEVVSEVRHTEHITPSPASLLM